MVGRVLRPDLTLPPADRGHALVLDVTGVSAQHDLCSLIDLSPRRPVRATGDEGLSLLELDELIEQEEERRVNSAAYEEYDGPVEVVEFDPLIRSSARAWGKTAGGTYFLAAGKDYYVFLNDALSGIAGEYDVVWCAKSADAAGLTEHRGLSLEMALSWGEDWAMERAGEFRNFAEKSAPWRKRRVDVSSSQYAQAGRVGIAVPLVRDEDGTYRSDMRKGELSDLDRKTFSPPDALTSSSRKSPTTLRSKGECAFQRGRRPRG